MNSRYRVRTQPYSWVLEERKQGCIKWSAIGYHNELDKLDIQLRQKGTKLKTIKRFREKIFIVLNIDENQTSALFLTKEKHPHFRKRVNPKSVENLKKNKQKFVSRVLMQLRPEIDKCSKKY